MGKTKVSGTFSDGKRFLTPLCSRIGPTLFLLLFDAVKVALTAQEELPADDRRGSAEAVVQLVHRQRLRRVVAMAQDLRDAG